MRKPWIIGISLLALTCAPAVGQAAGQNRPEDEASQQNAATSESQQESQQQQSQQSLEQSQQKMSALKSISDNLMDKSIKNTQGENLGEVQDVLIDPKSGQVAYLIVEEHVVPFKALTRDQQGELLALDINAEQFKQSPTKEEDMASRDFGTRVHQFYGVSPYWEEGQSSEQQQQLQQDQMQMEQERPLDQFGR